MSKTVHVKCSVLYCCNVFIKYGSHPARVYFNVPTGTDVLGDLKSVLEGFGNPCLKTVATLNHPVFRREIFGILLNVLETSQTLSLLHTVNEVIFLAVIGR